SADEQHPPERDTDCSSPGHHGVTVDQRPRHHRCRRYHRTAMIERPSTVGTWTFADLWEAAADRFGDSPAQRCGDRTFTWTGFDRRADGVAAALSDAGLSRGSKVAQHLFNGPEYLEVQFACSKAGFVPVNTNYRYTGAELVDLWSDAGVEAVVFHGDLAERCA